MTYIFQIIYVISEENKLLLPYPPHLNNVIALPCKMHKFFIFFISSRISSTNLQYGRGGSILLRHGLNFSRAWWTMQLISGEKHWKHVAMQKVVTLNTACMTFHLPHIITGFFSAPPMPTHNRLFSEPPTFGGMQHIFSVRWKSCAFYKVVRWHFSGVVGKGVTVCFLLR